MIYHNKYGILNWFLTAIGRKDLCQVWLNNTDLVMLLVTIPLIWQYIGYYMVIILSAIASISTDIFESAEIDGANGFQKAVYITLPLIKNTMLVCITLCIAGNMKAFDNIFVMTKGGPGTASNSVTLQIYKEAFTNNNYGLGSAESIIYFLFVMVITQLVLKAFSRREVDL